VPRERNSAESKKEVAGVPRERNERPPQLGESWGPGDRVRRDTAIAVYAGGGFGVSFLDPLACPRPPQKKSPPSLRSRLLQQQRLYFYLSRFARTPPTSRFCNSGPASKEVEASAPRSRHLLASERALSASPARAVVGVGRWRAAAAGSCLRLLRSCEGGSPSRRLELFFLRSLCPPASPAYSRSHPHQIKNCRSPSVLP
jgi:hypothetical protein